MSLKVVSTSYGLHHVIPVYLPFSPSLLVDLFHSLFSHLTGFDLLCIPDSPIISIFATAATDNGIGRDGYLKISSSTAAARRGTSHLARMVMITLTGLLPVSGRISIVLMIHMTVVSIVVAAT